MHWGKVDRASVYMDDAVEVTVVMEERSAWPFSVAFWYCSQWDSSSWQWERRVWYVSWDWSWSQIQSLSLWYHTACCRTMSFSISCVLGCRNLHWEMRVDLWLDRAWIPSFGSWQMSERSLSQKCSSDLIVVLMASSTSLGVL